MKTPHLTLESALYLAWAAEAVKFADPDPFTSKAAAQAIERSSELIESGSLDAAKRNNELLNQKGNGAQLPRRRYDADEHFDRMESEFKLDRLGNVWDNAKEQFRKLQMMGGASNQNLRCPFKVLSIQIATQLKEIDPDSDWNSKQIRARAKEFIMAALDEAIEADEPVKLGNVFTIGQPHLRENAKSDSTSSHCSSRNRLAQTS